MAENASHESQTYPERSQGVKSPQSPTTLIINGVERQLVVRKNESLLHALRRHSYRSVKMGCNTGDCGVCTVLLDGRPVRSCMTRAVAADGHTVTTVEGLAPSDPIMQAFMEVGAIQCGYCTPGQVMAQALKIIQRPLDGNPLDKIVAQNLEIFHLIR